MYITFLISIMSDENNTNKDGLKDDEPAIPTVETPAKNVQLIDPLDTESENALEFFKSVGLSYASFRDLFLRPIIIEGDTLRTSWITNREWNLTGASYWNYAPAFFKKIKDSYYQTYIEYEYVFKRFGVPGSTGFIAFATFPNFNKRDYAVNEITDAMMINKCPPNKMISPTESQSFVMNYQTPHWQNYTKEIMKFPTDDIDAISLATHVYRGMSLTSDPSRPFVEVTNTTLYPKSIKFAGQIKKLTL